MKVTSLLLTIDDIHFPNIWTIWLKNSIINKLTVTKWGHFTNAIVNLLKSTLLMIFQMKSIKKEKNNQNNSQRKKNKS